MIVYDAPVTPDALTAFMRAVPTDASLALTALFPQPTSQSNEVELAEITRTNRVARYRNFDGRIHSSQRDGTTGVKVPLLPLSSSLNMGELERLTLEFARTGGTRTEALVDAIYNDAEILVAEARNRVELAWGSVLSTGKLEFPVDDGIDAELDFGMTLTPTAAADWATATTDVAADLDEWIADYIAENGSRPAAMLTSNKYARSLRSNEGIVNAMLGTTSGRTRVSAEDVQSWLVSEGYPMLLPAYDLALELDSGPERVIPENKVIFLPANWGQYAQTRWGVSATALELVNSNEADMTFADAPGLVGVVDKMGPPYRQVTYIDGVGNPLLVSAKRFMAATVGA